MAKNVHLCPPPTPTPGGQEIFSNNETANVVNDYFCTICTIETVNPLLSGKFQIESSTPKRRFQTIAKFTTLNSF